MVAQVVTQAVRTVLIHQDVRRNAVYLKLLAKILPLLIVQAEMLAFDIGNHGLVFHERRCFVSKVNPYQIIAFQLRIF